MILTLVGIIRLFPIVVSRIVMHISSPKEHDALWLKNEFVAVIISHFYGFYQSEINGSGIRGPFEWVDLLGDIVSDAVNERAVNISAFDEAAKAYWDTFASTYGFNPDDCPYPQIDWSIYFDSFELL